MENLVNQNFWMKKRVFITGHTGFKGAWLTLWLQRFGAEVTGYSLDPPSKPSLYELAHIKNNINDVRADVRDYHQLKRAVESYRPEIIFHLAAQALVRQSYKDPIETYSTNVMGTVNLLETVRKVSGVRAIINVTSDKCYENREWVWGYRESDPMGGYDPYSSSKGCSELVTAAYRNSFFNPTDYPKHGVALASARAGNVIGGGDWGKNRLIPDCIRAILKREKIVIRQPSSTRPWQHVLEPLNGYLMLAERLYHDGVKFTQGWNFGPFDHDAKTVEWMVRKFCEGWNNAPDFVIERGPQPHEAHYLKLDCSKAMTELGWRPKWDVETALNKVIQWTKQYQDGEDIRNTCHQQIDEYIASPAYQNSRHVR
jgi:CDP-glucose 4,6-dehydratase